MKRKITNFLLSHIHSEMQVKNFSKFSQIGLRELKKLLFPTLSSFSGYHL